MIVKLLLYTLYFSILQRRPNVSIQGNLEINIHSLKNCLSSWLIRLRNINQMSPQVFIVILILCRDNWAKVTANVGIYLNNVNIIQGRDLACIPMEILNKSDIKIPSVSLRLLNQPAGLHYSAVTNSISAQKLY